MGLHIDTVIYTQDYMNSILKEKLKMFSFYLKTFNIHHKKHLGRLQTKTDMIVNIISDDMTLNNKSAPDDESKKSQKEERKERDNVKNTKTEDTNVEDKDNSNNNDNAKDNKNVDEMNNDEKKENCDKKTEPSSSVCHKK